MYLHGQAGGARERKVASTVLPVAESDNMPHLSLECMNLSPEGGRQEAGCHATSFSFLA